MSWRSHRSAWVWTVLAVVGLAGVLAVRLTSPWSGQPATVLQTDGHGVVGVQSDDLTALAERMRLLQQEIGRTREQLAAAQAEAATKRENLAAVEEMLATDRLTQCPGFLRDETTVRALQKIIREAANLPQAGDADVGRLTTAATVARERLRSRLEAMRDQLADEASRLQRETETLQDQLRIQMHEADAIERQVRRHIERRGTENVGH